MELESTDQGTLRTGVSPLLWENLGSAEEADEVLPNGLRVEKVGVLIRLADDLTGQEAAIFAEGDEEDAVEDFLRGGE